MTGVIIHLSRGTFLEVAKPLYPQDFSICITQENDEKGNKKSTSDRNQVNLTIKEYEILKGSMILLDGLIQFCKDQDPLAILQ